MTTPQTAILSASSECMRIARSLLANGEMLQVARADSEIVRVSQTNLRRLAVQLDNAAVTLQQAMLTTGGTEE